MNPLDPLLNSVPPSQRNMTEALLRNQMKRLFDLDGPYLCTRIGTLITAEEAADPKYIPYIRFERRGRTGDPVLSEHDIYIYRPDTDELFIYGHTNTPTMTKIEERKSYHDELLERIRTFDIKIWKTPEIPDFLKFTMPLIRKSFPKLLAQSLVSVQPMTSPVFYNNLIQGKGGNAGSSKNTNPSK